MKSPVRRTAEEHARRRPPVPKLFCEVLRLPEEIFVILTVIAAAAIGALLAFVAYALVAPF